MVAKIVYGIATFAAVWVVLNLLLVGLEVLLIWFSDHIRARRAK